LRARRLAAEVALTKPDLIGLQEVYDYTVDGKNIGPPFVNHLKETLAALKDKGQRYVVAAKVENLDITIPIDIDKNGTLEMVRVLDRDVILVRKGVVSTPLAGDFTTGGLCGVSLSLPGLPLLKSYSSGDGCNYTIFALLNSPVGPIAIKRGFVGVDVMVRGKNYRVVNTHLEQRQPDPADPNSAILQFLQSFELVGTLQAITPPDLPLILLGDFNSSSEDESIGPIIPPYQVITGTIIPGPKFTDAWDKNPLKLFDPDGFTCCQLADLSNTTSELYERVDIIFIRDSSFLPLAFVTGRVPIFPLRLPPNWASDHGGVFAELIFR
jgi:hypothetical protein